MKDARALRCHLHRQQFRQWSGDTHRIAPGARETCRGTRACVASVIAGRASEKRGGPGRTRFHSHSIINEPSKLLICNAPEAVPQKFTVIFTVKVRSTSIGAGFRATRPEASFRDLSTSIDSYDDRG